MLRRRKGTENLNKNASKIMEVNGLVATYAEKAIAHRSSHHQEKKDKACSKLIPPTLSSAL